MFQGRLKAIKNFPKFPLYLKVILIVLFCLFLLFFLAGGTVLAYDYAYSQKIYLGVFVGNNNLSGLTREEAKNLLKNQISHYQNNNICLDYQKNEWWPSLSELGFTPNIERTVEEAYAVGRSGFILENIQEKLETLWQKKNMPFVYQTDKKKFINYTEKIGQKVNKPATNASLAFEGTNLKVIPAKKGLVIDEENLLTQVTEELRFLGRKKIKIPLKVDEPKIKEEDTKEAQKEALEMISTPLNLTYNDFSFVAEPAQIASWATFAPVKLEKKSSTNNVLGELPLLEKWTLKVGLNEDKIREFLVTIAEEINIDPKDTVVTFSDGQKFVLERGYDGRALDLDNAVSQIKEELTQGGDRQVALVVKTIPAGEVEATSYGIVPITKDKYIDVSLSKQVLTCFDGGKAQFITLISSGIDKYPTPAGTFYIYSKVPSTRMRHEYGPGHPDNYDLPNVPYAMFFSGPYSIHGTYWHNNFGHPMSHGCVNAPTPAAEWIYNWAPIGTLVYIHW